MENQRFEIQIEIFLFRHGATAANREHRYLGRTEEPLSPEGRQKLLEEKKRGNYPQVEELFLSPMLRCAETAELIYPQKNGQTIPEWREMDFGAFEGKNYQELKDDKRYQAWIDSNGTLAFPEGESREEFITRVVAGFQNMLQQLARRSKTGKMPKTVGIIVHGGTIMALMSYLTGGEYFDFQVKNGAGYQCTLAITENAMQLTSYRKR